MTPIVLFAFLFVVALWACLMGLNAKTETQTTCVLLLVSMFLLVAFCCEFMDLFCPEIKYNCQGCGDGCGHTIAKFAPTPDTTPQEASKNIRGLVYQKDHCVIWRRSLISSCLVTLVLCLLLKEKLSGKEILAIIIANFAIIGTMQTFYTYHYEKYLSKILKENLDIIIPNKPVVSNTRSFT